MREKLTCFFLIIFNRRITPACAGKTSSALICLSWSWDHPRVCGKNISDILKMVRVLGSPPLLREKRISTPFVQVNCGITPACAGKTFDSIWECQSCQDYPRFCGKKPAKMTRMLTAPGSPPRVREKQAIISHQTESHGITPASAGKTDWQRISQEQWQDHPRVCGKNVVQNTSLKKIWGSPPRVREKLFYVNKADTITYFRKFSQRCFLRSTFFLP